MIPDTVRILLLTALIALASPPVWAGSPPDTTAVPGGVESRTLALRVYLDCPGCDGEFIRSEITFVNYVRDRHDAQVHILVTTQRTGSGGKEHTVTLLGREMFAGQNDTLLFVSKEDDSEESLRQEMVRVMKLGLVRFVARTPLARNIVIGYEQENVDSRVVDPWDFWVFKSNLRTYLNGEQSHELVSLYANLSASRVTTDLKVRVEGWGDYTEDNFEIEEDRIVSISSGYGFETFGVFSLDDHWSAGGDVTVSTSTYSNLQFAFSAGPALEYDVFPYSESTRRQLRISLMPVYKFVRYNEETIYDRMQEHLFQGRLSAALEMKQPWGSVEIQVEGSLYFHDAEKNRLRFSIDTSLHLLAGLSFEVDGNVSMIHDQLALPKSGATTEEILLQRRQLATQYQYYVSAGLSYTFGSIYNNVVNPRFGDF